MGELEQALDDVLEIPVFLEEAEKNAEKYDDTENPRFLEKSQEYLDEAIEIARDAVEKADELYGINNIDTRHNNNFADITYTVNVDNIDEDSDITSKILTARSIYAEIDKTEEYIHELTGTSAEPGTEI